MNLLSIDLSLALSVLVTGLVIILLVLNLRKGAPGGDAAEAVRREMVDMRAEIDRKDMGQRRELQDAIKASSDSLDKRLDMLANNLNTHFTAFAELQVDTGKQLSESQKQRLSETNQAVLKLVDTLQTQQAEGRKAMQEELEKVRQTLSQNLESLRKENDEKLEKMRATVEEKLQGTLEQRLGESFKQVSERLEAVHKGLGEMQTLANGVGDLKRVLTNVKTRGGWGEMQLGALLEEMLAPEQYETNAVIEPGSSQRVEFAVRMPGQGEHEHVLLPIDAKFPHEDYDRLLDAQERGDLVQIETETKALERAIRNQARIISDSYVRPPHSTDFAIMYLPTEGLYAEVARRPGLVRELQTACRVMVAGPSNLAAFLNSLQMGFRTLAIQKRSSEVWQVLGAAKAEFQRYGGVWDKLGKQLDTARRTVDEAGRRTRAVERRLRNVEAIEAPVAALFIAADDVDEEDAPPVSEA